MAEHRGGCHCGNLRVTLLLTQEPAVVRLRACGCSFCRAHNTRTASDPDGFVSICAGDWAQVQFYRFGTGTANFVICRNCGVYIGAIGEPRRACAPSSTPPASTTGRCSLAILSLLITMARRRRAGSRAARPTGPRRQSTADRRLRKFPEATTCAPGAGPDSASRRDDC